MVNLLQRESSEYISYNDIKDFVIVELIQRFSIVTYLSCMFKNVNNHKILFADFNLKLSQLETMYHSVKHVLSSNHALDKEPR